MLDFRGGVRFWSMIKRVLTSLKYDKLNDIDGVDPVGEELYVRGKNLNSLIGKISFSEAIFHLLMNRMPDEIEKKIFDAVLVSFHAGFGFSTPSVLIPRLAASTGTSVPGSLAAGFSSGGKHHLGATQEAMKIYEKILKTKAGDLKEHTERCLQDKIGEGERIFGFGHPLFKKDPRPSHLRAILEENSFKHDYITIYDTTRDFLEREKGVFPNIDGINAAILLALGFNVDHGAGLFLISRTSAMLAHVVEERTKEPFYSERRLYPIFRMLEKYSE